MTVRPDGTQPRLHTTASTTRIRAGPPTGATWCSPPTATAAAFSCWTRSPAACGSSRAGGGTGCPRGRPRSCAPTRRPLAEAGSLSLPRSTRPTRPETPMMLRHVATLALALLVLGACRKRPEVVPAPADAFPTADADAARADSIRLAEADRLERERMDRDRLEREAARARAVLTDIVFFDYDSYEIGFEAEQVLQAKIPLLRANPGVRIRIEGHADQRGSTEYNLALGQRRARGGARLPGGYGIERGGWPPAATGRSARWWTARTRRVVAQPPGGVRDHRRRDHHGARGVPVRGARLAAAVALLPLLGACATKSDLRDLRNDMEAQRAAQDAAIRAAAPAHRRAARLAQPAERAHARRPGQPAGGHRAAAGADPGADRAGAAAAPRPAAADRGARRRGAAHPGGRRARGRRRRGLPDELYEASVAALRRGSVSTARSGFEEFLRGQSRSTGWPRTRSSTSGRRSSRGRTPRARWRRTGGWWSCTPPRRARPRRCCGWGWWSGSAATGPQARNPLQPARARLPAQPGGGRGAAAS
jgi:peptidoglycan-associated lipoprotein